MTTAISGVAAMAKLAKPSKGEAALVMMVLVVVLVEAPAGVLTRIDICNVACEYLLSLGHDADLT